MEQQLTPATSRNVHTYGRKQGGGTSGQVQAYIEKVVSNLSRTVGTKGSRAASTLPPEKSTPCSGGAQIAVSWLKPPTFAFFTCCTALGDLKSRRERPFGRWTAKLWLLSRSFGMLGAPRHVKPPETVSRARLSTRLQRGNCHCPVAEKQAGPCLHRGDDALEGLGDPAAALDSTGCGLMADGPALSSLGVCGTFRAVHSS